MIVTGIYIKGNREMIVAYNILKKGNKFIPVSGTYYRKYNINDIEYNKLLGRSKKCI